ncbi:hypothetical protein [Corynebacterium timonense]|uniref:PE family protein n=1 Tax=Corynebacterium timonense TaxID=441500 RepID=A0A1H1SJC0_9CORY|nr:hypothetical protein [Corynebacterium timonense]SDS47908.1 hypothetical protein SAMN04488539_1755 [Corynebacterium timonense]
MSVPLNVDPEVARAELRAAVDEHQQVIADLRANLPDFPPGAAGQGFADTAGGLSRAMVRVQQLTIEFMENRVAAWEQILALVGTVEASDATTAEALGGGAR